MWQTQPVFQEGNSVNDFKVIISESLA